MGLCVQVQATFFRFIGCSWQLIWEVLVFSSKHDDTLTLHLCRCDNRSGSTMARAP